MRKNLDRYEVKPDGCWEWNGRKNSKGYGIVTFLAHRVFYESINGPIKDGLVVDHKCRNHGCVNPAHLEAVTTKENLLRGETHAARNAKKTHCPKGHPYSGDNLRIDYHHDGNRRVCKICKKQHKKKWLLKQEAKRRSKNEILPH